MLHQTNVTCSCWHSQFFYMFYCKVLEWRMFPKYLNKAQVPTTVCTGWLWQWDVSSVDLGLCSYTCMWWSMVGRRSAWNGRREGWTEGSKKGKEKQLRRRMKTIKWRDSTNTHACMHAHTHTDRHTSTGAHTHTPTENTHKSTCSSQICQQ